MYAYRLRIAALAAVAAAGLTACTTPYGFGGLSVGNGYYGSNYGYGADYGYGYGGGYPGYGYGYGGGYPGYGYGYGAGYPGYALGYAPYWGWYDNFYYPGTGYYVYDRDRRPYRWTDEQRRYWSSLRERAVSPREFRERMEQRANEQNWSGFDQGPTASQRVQPVTDRSARIDRSIRQDRVQRSVRPERVERSIVRSERANRPIVREQRSSKARSVRTSEDRADRSDGRHDRGKRND